MTIGYTSIRLENPNYSEQELKFIESALIKAATIKSFEELGSSGLRVFVQGQDEKKYYVHIGSQDPYKGGSGVTYWIQKSDGKVELDSTETYAPKPEHE